jgi:hypothetical protein
MEPASRGPWFFLADAAQIADVAAAISDHWGVSVLVGPDLLGKSLSGRLVANSVSNALDAVSFLVSSQWRRDSGGSVFLLGGEKVESVVALPSYGISASQLGSLVGGEALVVGDRLILSAGSQRISEVRGVLASLADRQSALVELFILDVSTNTVERVGAWIDSMKAGVGFVARRSVEVATAGLTGGAANAVQVVQYAEPVYDVDLRGLLDLLERDKTSRVALRQQCEVLSGSTLNFELGDVVEDTLYVRDPSAPGGGTDLVTEIDRRTVGLVVQLSGVDLGERWHWKIKVDDGVRGAGRETILGLEAETLLPVSGPPEMVASYRRTTSESFTRTPLGMRPRGWFGRKLSQSTSREGERALMILIRPMGRSGR